MSKQKYVVQIFRVSPRHHHGMSYKVKVFWDLDNDYGDVSWAMTKWGAKREAKKLIDKHEDEEPAPVLEEEYSL